MEFIRVLSTKDLAPGEMKDVEANGKEILIVNLEGNFYALGNVCTHVGCLLSDGMLSGENIKCTCHGSTYNVKTGSVVTGPAKNPEPTFQVKVEKDQVLVNV